MTYEIKTSKGLYGWRAESTVTLGETPEGKRVLELTTSKYGKGLSASVSVFIYKDCSSSGFSSKTTEMFGDFYKNGISTTPCNRVTEKAVIEVHKHALQHMDDLVTEAKTFYADREAETL